MSGQFKDIESVLAKAAKQLAEIEQEYKKALHSQTVPDHLLVEIKDYLQNMRSALDYLANKIPIPSGYFPIANSQADFEVKVAGVPQSVRVVLERCQPFNGNDWLKWFNQLNNKNKHVCLVPQTRQEEARTTVSGPGGGSVSWGSGVTFGAGVSIMGVPIDPKTQLPVPNKVVNVTRTIWVSFMFDNSITPDIPATLLVLPFLKLVHQNVSSLVQDIRAVIA